MNGHAECIEILCQYLQGIEDIYVLNKKQFTTAHVAINSNVLKTLYENGSNLWLVDSKNRTPLFIASFFGRVDCIGFLLG